MKFLKLHWLIIAVFLIILGGTFYWFQYRPSKIRHDCSWVRVYEAEKSAEPGISKEEAEKNRQECYNNCETDDVKICFCKFMNFEPQSSKLAVPAKEWWREARNYEYEFCLHDKGLK